VLLSQISTWRKILKFSSCLPITVHLFVSVYPPVTRTQRWRYILDESASARVFSIFEFSVYFFDFLPLKFAACSKPPSRDNHRKAPYPRTQHETGS